VHALHENQPVRRPHNVHLLLLLCCRCQSIRRRQAVIGRGSVGCGGEEAALNVLLQESEQASDAAAACEEEKCCRTWRLATPT
jgi:hypothetical protein